MLDINDLSSSDLYLEFDRLFLLLHFTILNSCALFYNYCIRGDAVFFILGLGNFNLVTKVALNKLLKFPINLITKKARKLQYVCSVSSTWNLNLGQITCQGSKLTFFATRKLLRVVLI